MAVESFKSYERGSRVQVPEELYNKGIQYTNAPLDQGFCKMMVNYDLKDNGNIITPRPGLKTELSGTLDARNLEFFDKYNTHMYLCDAREIVEEDGKTYRQVIVGHPDTKQLYVYTTQADKPTVSWMAKLNEVPSSKFIIPQAPEIHGVPILDARAIARQVGTFAFNNSYYYFTDYALCHTYFVNGGALTPAHYLEMSITPRRLTPSEAVMWGYNMLLPNPYLFNNTMLGASSPISLDGVLPYDTNDTLALSPQVNQALHFECFYKGYVGKTYTVKWEWKEPGAGVWTELKTATVTIAADLRLLCDFNVPNTAVMLRITVTNTVPAEAADMQVMAVGFDFGKTNQGSAANSIQTTYDLKAATSMAFWKNRLVLVYKNLLFFSEINDPSYFPYPNNMEPFSEPIIHIVPYLDNLLVFTTSKLYSITLGVDGLSWTVKQIQGNLTIKDCDLHLIQIVKNMVFFKSGNYYYMVVPKISSLTGELTIAPVSRPIETLLDNFQAGIDKLLKTLYDYSDVTTLLYYYNFLDFEDVHNVYVFQTTKGVFVNVDLLYNTVLRTWRVYVFESQTIIKSFRQDATTKGTFMTLTPINEYPSIQFLKFDAVSCVDNYIAPNNVVHTIFFKNYQMLDTGYRNIVSNLKKRFREAQLKLNNRSGKTLKFYTEFYIDGDTRKTFYRYTPRQELDPGSPNYGLLSMERELVDPSVLPGTTMLGETQEDYNHWTLGVSQFPDTSLWKIRIPFSGKGYCPQMKLVSHNEEPYELLNNIWVFRQLNSR